MLLLVIVLVVIVFPELPKLDDLAHDLELPPLSANAVWSSMKKAKMRKRITKSYLVFIFISEEILYAFASISYSQLVD